MKRRLVTYTRFKEQQFRSQTFYEIQSICIISVYFEKQTQLQRGTKHLSNIFHIAFTFEINSVTSVEDLVTVVTEESDHRT